MSFEKIEIKLQHVTDLYNDIPLPEYATEGSSGLDLRAAVENDVIIPKGKISLVPTNLRVEIPHGYEMQVRPRSGLAAKHGIGVLNSPGTIDSDYRGEIKVIMLNLGAEPFEVNRGDRIAQMVISPYDRASWEESDSLGTTPRGEGGFGSTGK